MADYHSPRPTDTLGYRMNGFLRIKCLCGRALIQPVRDMVRVHRLRRDLCFDRLIVRLRCKACGQRPVDVDVSMSNDWRGWV